jgi:hypothetical protein
MNSFRRMADLTKRGKRALPLPAKRYSVETRTGGKDVVGNLRSHAALQHGHQEQRA